MTRSGSGICFDWQNGRCSRRNCQFRHGNGPTNQNQQRSGICRQWQTTGTCSFGISCRFNHSGGSSTAASSSTISNWRSSNNQNSNSATATATTTNSNNSSTKQFLKHLSQIKQPTQLSRELAQSSQLWLRCWQDYLTLDRDGLRMLVESLARAPGSLNIEPPPMEVIEGAFKAYLANQGSSSVSNETLLTQGKTTLAAVTRLLQFEWYPPKEAIQESLANIAIKAEGLMRKENKEHRILSMDLMTLVERIEQPWTIKIRELALICQDVVEAKEEPVSYADWKTANVKWLCNPQHFAPSSCPKMKVGSEGVYDSSEEYIQTVYRLWIAMTFADGHAAFAPHCRARTQTGTNCNSSLWPMPKSAQTNSMNCRTTECRRPVAFACRVARHDALCNDCAMRSIEKHKKGPAAGMNASTHIYDCRVHQVGQDGILYLTEFKSRNPPQKPIHWRTTNRLSPPNLVGVVKTRTKGADLQDGDLIKWGECTYHGDSRSEERRRNNGELAINLSTIVEFDPEFFEEGSYVAVIDCMAFVPEWIPVLKALESQQQIKVPFEDGKYLNLLKHSPVELNNFWNAASLKDVTSTKNWEMLELMVDHSTLEPIREIRRHTELRDRLVSRLDALVTQATLDKGQLISFVDSLQHPVHLTQGPPGTGKSYLGVVVVRALLIIRDLWLEKGTARAPPPILVLSYKNHAIDEFLVDLIKAEPHAMRNRLIRLGGQCKDDRLSLYTERSTWQSNSSVVASRDRLQALQLLRSSIRQTVDGDIASFLAHRQSFRMGMDARERHKEIVTATNKLMEMIARRTLLKQALEELKEKGGDYTTPAEVIEQLSFLEVIEDSREGKRHASLDIQRFCQKVDKEKIVPLLCHGLEHYEYHQHWGDILLMFLSGKIPLPPCEFVLEEGTTCGRKAVDPKVPLCDDHRCCQETGATRCTRPCRSATADYCEAHVCDVTGCREARFETQKYCRRHCCRQCLTLNLDVCQRALGAPPRNVCKEHPLCVFPSCEKPCLKDGIYCNEHNNPKCLALTKKGKPCKTPPFSRLMPYCMAHKHLHKMLDFGSDSDDDDEEDGTEKEKVIPVAHRQRCAAITKKGHPCKGSALSGKRYCYDHDFPTEEALTGDDIPSPETNKDDNPAVEDVFFDAMGVDLEREDELLYDNKDANSVHSGISVHSISTQGSVLNVDEAEKKEFDEMELEEGENLQHLRDVFEVAEENEEEDFETESDGESSFEEEFSNSEGRPEPSTGDECIDSTTWSWTMNEDDRWAACQGLLGDLRHLMARASVIVKSCIVVAHKEHQQSIIKAKAEVYENKSVIGGTMVGCVSRLESIRATRPFAVVVEEASEVLEPLLFSCLTESTIKLEMIGDHRQLHPSVMSRYEFELHNKINVSMFQRLIEAPPGHQIPSTVLSIQRRMRPNICDLTREHYADVVAIEDEARCGQQRIGERTSPMAPLTSSTMGREVPGVGPHIFLWTHKGVQKRSNVGVSRINPVEATMACSLAKYLVECGVPKKSIAILTPYKGQLMEIRRMLQQGNNALLSRNPKEVDVCRLSTVDRFQGDEEDIIICSLVVDEKSKTNFVKLVNRMIVLLSRARLGLYILANESYFQNESNVPKHWMHTLEHLELPGKNDSTITTLDPKDIFSGSRSGNELPLCCPIHRSITKNVSLASELCRGFCTEICEATLPCGHPCRLKCHWPGNVHNPKCDALMDSPCDDHPQKMPCHQLYPYKVPSVAYKASFKCSNVVELTLPCKHTMKESCWRKKEINSGIRSIPPCNKESPIRFKFANCEHELKVTCSELETYTSNPSAVKCQQDELFEPVCGHNLPMKCWEYQDHLSGARAFACKQKVDIILPRCGHTGKQVPCATALALRSWHGKRCQEVGNVIEGTDYGPLDYHCKENVTLIRKCGHDVIAPCHEAMAKSSCWPACRKKCKAHNPDCGHACKLPCTLRNVADGVPIPEPIDSVVEGQKFAPPSQHAASFPECHEKIQITRMCAHIETIRCSESRKPLHPCKIGVTASSPLCGHDISVPCGLKKSLEKLTFWDDKTMRSVSLDKKIPSTSEFMLDTNCIGSDKTEVLLSCTGELLMTLPCGHELPVKCKEIFGNMTNRNKLGLSCQDEATVTLTCGHTVSTTCMNAQCVATGKPHSVECDKSKMHQCWNFESCGNKVAKPCSLKGSIACDAISEWVCPKGTHTFSIPICSKGVPNICPNCCVEELEEQLMIRDDHPIRDLIAAIFSSFPTTIQAQDDNGLSRIKELLNKHIDIQKGIPLWQRTSLQMQLFPCMCVLNEPTATEVSFDPSTLVKKKTLNGLMTKLLTEVNVEKMLNWKKKDPFKLLVGVAAVVKGKDLRMSRMPTKTPEKSTLIQNLWSEAYDSVLYLSPRGEEELVQWDPYALQAMLVAELDKNDLKKLAQKLGEVPLIALKDPIEMSFSAPKDLVRINTGQDGGFHGDDDQSIDLNDESIALQQSLVGTRLEGFVVDIEWTGGIGVLDGKNRNIEKDLLTKMKFVNRKAKPFQAIKQIENLLTKSPELHILHLLLSAECVLHSSLGRANDELETYLQKGQKTVGDFRIHPWILVILARLDSTYSKQLLSSFVNHFPLFTDILSDDENALIRNVVPSTGDGVTLSWSDKLKESWRELQENNCVQSNAMDELLKLTGLKKVKEEALLLWRAALQLQRMDNATRKENPIVANYCFLGNPGTGKTTVARLFAAILRDCGVRAGNVFEETTAQEAKDAGADGFRGKVAQAIGGVLFIDEAYDLDPIGDSKGKPIVNEILTLCENRRDEISVILAGYEDDFEKKFFNYNAGLRSRFKCVTFDDFDNDELALIWTGMRSKKKWQEEDGVTRVVVKRLAKLAGKKGFGNAREVRMRLEKSTQEAMARLGKNFSQANMILSISDVIGEDPRLSNEKLVKVRHQIESKIGWERIKGQVDELIKVCGMNYGRELRGETPLDIFLNRMFLGNPGTGKTTCAKLYGRLLKELGFLSSGDVVFKTASDFIGMHVGESQQRTNQILDGAKGKVLIIDEAYALDDPLYGKQVLDTLVEKVQGGPSDDMAVILIGYEEQMLEMLRKQNPGLARRFPKEQAFYFDDYDESQLLEILDLNLQSNQVEASMAFRQKALDVLGVQKLQANFGNAGAVETLIKGAIVKASERSSTSERIVLDAVDILDPGSERSEKNEDPLAVLDSLYRMEQVKSKLEEMRKTWEVSRREGDEKPNLGHFVFTGSPGTGKTTVARAIASILFSLGLLPTDKFVETSALDLQADFVGQTSTKVDNALQEAKGGLLFVDEAYNLGQGPFGKEACDSLVAGMTSEKFRDVVVVIAGYAYEIHEMLKSNSGLKSRFTHFFDFPDWNPQDCVSFFTMLCEKKCFEAEDGVMDIIYHGCSKLMRLEGWANGRDVTKLWESAKRCRDVRVYEELAAEKTLTIADVEKSVKEMQSARASRTPKKSHGPNNHTYNMPNFDLANGQPPRRHVKLCPPSNSMDDPNELEDVVSPALESVLEEGRDPGVTNDVWKELKEAKELAAQLEHEYQACENRLRTTQNLAKDLERQRCEQEQKLKELLEELARENEEAERQRIKEERELLEEKLRKLEEEARRVEAERRKVEAELQRLEEERRKRAETLRKIQTIRPCPMGFTWFRCGRGWRCAGGSHYVSDEELRSRFC